MPGSQGLLTIKQAAEVLGVTSDRVRWLCLADRLPCTRESRRRNARYLIRRYDAEALRETLREDKASASNDLAQAHRRAVPRVVPAVAQPKGSEQSKARRETDTTEDHELLTTKQVAELTGMTYPQVHSLCIHDQIPHLRENDRRSARYLIRRCDAEALRAKLQQDTTSARDGN